MIDEILEEVLTLSQKLQRIRETYAEMFKDETIPIKKSLAAQARLKMVLTKLSLRFDSTEERRLFEWSSIGDLSEALPEAAHGDPRRSSSCS